MVSQKQPSAEGAYSRQRAGLVPSYCTEQRW